MDIAATTRVTGEAHRTTSDGKELFLWAKRAVGPRRGTVLFVHGSSMPTQPTFDLQVEGMPEASVMDWFATRGFDAWTFDCRGYGRSYKGPEVWASVTQGAEDTKAAADYITASGTGPLLVYGISSGALRASMFAQRHPEMVERLALEALVWTGEGSPTLEQRRKKIDDWRATTRRPIDRAFLMAMFTRDHAGVVEERFVEPLIQQVLAIDDSSPNGTYVDMCTLLPLVDPEKITVPTMVLRGQYDGIAGFDDLLAFFKRLPNPDKGFTVIPGVSHGSFRQKNFLLTYQILHAFFTRPEAAFKV